MPPVRIPMSMPYDAQDARSRMAGNEHGKRATLAQALLYAARIGATVDEVKAAFPEIADEIDRAIIAKSGRRP